MDVGLVLVTANYGLDFNALVYPKGRTSGFNQVGRIGGEGGVDQITLKALGDRALVRDVMGDNHGRYMVHPESAVDECLRYLAKPTGL